MHTVYIPSPHHAVAHLSLWERLRLPPILCIFKRNMKYKPTSPLLWGEEQGEGVRFTWGKRNHV